MTLLRPAGWTEQGACVGAVTRTRDPWNPPDELTPTERRAEMVLARSVCAGCPVRHDCALEALENGIADGMWGGLLPAERRSIAREYGFPVPGAAQHGTRSMYVAGCHAGPDGGSCEDCRASHARYEVDRRAIRKAAGEAADATLAALDDLGPRERVLAVARAARRPLTAREVYRRVGVKASTVRAVLDAAAAAGDITPHRRRLVA